MKKNRPKTKEKTAESNPGLRPPYQALKITARKKSETGERSKKGQVTCITPANNAGVTSAARYRRAGERSFLISISTPSPVKGSGQPKSRDRESGRVPAS